MRNLGQALDRLLICEYRVLAMRSCSVMLLCYPTSANPAEQLPYFLTSLTSHTCSHRVATLLGNSKWHTLRSNTSGCNPHQPGKRVTLLKRVTCSAICRRRLSYDRMREAALQWHKGDSIVARDHHQRARRHRTGCGESGDAQCPVVHYSLGHAITACQL